MRKSKKSEKDLPELARAIKRKRKAEGLTQVEFGKKYGDVGPVAVSRWETDGGN